MAIQRFLKELLSKQEVVEGGEEILEALGLPPSFYSLPNHIKEVEETARKHSVSARSTNSQEDGDVRASRLCRSSHAIKNRRTSIFRDIPEMLEESIHPRHPRRQISIQDILEANEVTLGHFSRLSEAIFRHSEGE